MSQIIYNSMKILSPYAYFAPEYSASSYLWQNLHEDFMKRSAPIVKPIGMQS